MLFKRKQLTPEDILRKKKVNTDKEIKVLHEEERYNLVRIINDIKTAEVIYVAEKRVKHSDDNFDLLVFVNDVIFREIDFVIEIGGLEKLEDMINTFTESEVFDRIFLCELNKNNNKIKGFISFKG